MPMDELNLSIDGRAVKGAKGSTILDVCRANDVYVPTLCNIDGLSGSGGCRLCLVDVEGQKRPVPACMTPAAEGMKVVTNTKQLAAYRRMALELLLSERNHFCFFCEKSGDCELQSLCYEFGIDHMSFPAMFPPLALDASAEALAIDNNRCILCGRCVRVCSEIVGNNTLDFTKRGSNTVINEPDLFPLGESNCVQCGACAEVCPTGAIFGKLSSYKGRKAQCKVLRTSCCECPMGCDLTVYVRDNNVVLIAGGGLKGRFGGQLCKVGRFDLLARNHERIAGPRILKGKSQTQTDLPSALEAASNLLRTIQRKHGKDGVAGIISPRCTNEAIKAFKDFVEKALQTKNVFIWEPEIGVLSEGIARALDKEGLGRFSDCKTSDLLDADLIVAIGLGAAEPHPIIASNIRRALNRGAHFVSVGGAENALSARASLVISSTKGTLAPAVQTLINVTNALAKGDQIAIDNAMGRSSGIRPADLAAFVSLVRGAKKVVTIAGGGIDPDPALVRSVALLAATLGKAEGGSVRVIFLGSGGNIRGALGVLGPTARSMPTDLRKLGIRAAYALLSDEEPAAVDAATLGGLDAIIVQASFESDLSGKADVVIPSPTWAARSGSMTDIDGTVRQVSPVLAAPEGVVSDEEAIRGLERSLGGPEPRKRKGGMA